MPTVYVLTAPSPDPAYRGLVLPVGCVLRDASTQKEFFLNRTEALVWRDILREQVEPKQWETVKDRLPGYEVWEYQDERGFETAFRLWQAYVPLAWDSRGQIGPPLIGRELKRGPR